MRPSDERGSTEASRPNVQQPRGFSLLELLMVIAILGILGAAGFGYYVNVAKNIEISTVARTLASELRDARARAMGGESRRKWGVHAVNGASDYFEVFSTPTNYANGGTTINRTQYLFSGAAFSDPSEGTSKDIIFTGISGTTTASSLTLTSQTQSITVSVTALGLIY